MNPAERAARYFGIYYGWIIVAVSLLSMAFWFGVRSSFSVFYVALLEDFHWGRGESAGVQSIALIMYTVMSPTVGGLIDRLGPRRVIVPGILVLSLGLFLCATIETLGQFYFLYGVIVGIGVTFVSIVPHTAILSHWFVRNRGLASGIAVSGIGVGTFALVPLSQQFIDMWGWRATFLILGGLVFVILIPLSLLILRHKPQDLGLLPDGLKEKPPPPEETPLKTGSPRREWTLKGVLSTGRFWALFLFAFLSLLGVYIVIVHNVRFMVDQGIDRMTAAFVFALVGVVSSIFRIFWGGLSDRIGREKTYTMGTACMCMGVGSLMLIEILGEHWLIYPFFVFFGMGWGATAPMFMATTADLFGRSIGLIYGIVEGGIGISGAFGAWVAGFIFDRTGSYQWAFILTIAVFALSCLFIWVAAPRKSRALEQY